MKLVIEIDKDKNDRLDYLDVITLKEIIRNGKPLPKGHGRIVDENKITSFGWNSTDNHAVVDAPTIMEADKESEVKE